MAIAHEPHKRITFNPLLYAWGALAFVFVCLLNVEMLPNTERILCADEWVIDFGKFNENKRCDIYRAEDLADIPNTFASAIKDLTAFYGNLQLVREAQNIDPMLFLADEEIYVHKQIYPESDARSGGVTEGLLILADKLLLLFAIFLIVLVPVSYAIRYTLYVLVKPIARPDVLDRFFARGYTSMLLREFPIMVMLVAIVILSFGEYDTSFAAVWEELTLNGGIALGQFTSHLGDFLLISFSSGLFAILVSHVVDGVFLLLGRDPYGTYLDDLVAAIIVVSALLAFTQAGAATVVGAIVVALLHSLLQKVWFKSVDREA